jgi:CheY-like chemotaxis protein
MNGSPRVLVAAQPGAWRVLQTMLGGLVDLVPAHTMAEAFKILERERIDLIVTSIAFDESRMLEFLQAVKQTSPTGGIPFLCSRVLPSVMRDNLVHVTRDACKQCGAVDLVDIGRLPPDAAQDVMRKAVQACLRPPPGAPQAP